MGVIHPQDHAVRAVVLVWCNRVLPGSVDVTSACEMPTRELDVPRNIHGAAFAVTQSTVLASLPAPRVPPLNRSAACDFDLRGLWNQAS